MGSMAKRRDEQMTRKPRWWRWAQKIYDYWMKLGGSNAIGEQRRQSKNLILENISSMFRSIAKNEKRENLHSVIDVTFSYLISAFVLRVPSDVVVVVSLSQHDIQLVSSLKIIIKTQFFPINFKSRRSSAPAKSSLLLWSIDTDYRLSIKLKLPRQLYHRGAKSSASEWND